MAMRHSCCCRQLPFKNLPLWLYSPGGQAYDAGITGLHQFILQVRGGEGERVDFSLLCSPRPKIPPFVQERKAEILLYGMFISYGCNILYIGSTRAFHPHNLFQSGEIQLHHMVLIFVQLGLQNCRARRHIRHLRIHICSQIALRSRLAIPTRDLRSFQEALYILDSILPSPTQ